jgi:putative SOS response-associated peptidase YedK
VAIIRPAHAAKIREWALVQWGLVPSWSKDPSIGARLINARSETAAEKPSFRSALRRRRCLIPASGFYEWQRRPNGKQPYVIGMADGNPFAFAGLWEHWHGLDGSELETCTVLTTEANELMAPIHDRMPVILEPQDYADWLGTGEDSAPAEVAQLQHLMRPYPADQMKAYPVSNYVNDPRHEGAECIRPTDG